MKALRLEGTRVMSGKIGKIDPDDPLECHGWEGEGTNSPSGMHRGHLCCYHCGSRWAQC